MVSIQFTKMVVLGILKHGHFLHLKHGLHSHLEESYRKSNAVFQSTELKIAILQHVYNLIKLFVYLYNANQNLILFKIGGEIILN